MNQRLEQLVAERSRELFEANQGLAKEAAERRAAEMALWHAQKLDLIGQLTGGIAHDFNNLLTVISGNLELVQNALKSGDDLRPSGRNRVLERLASAEVATGNAAKITQQLLAFARRGTLALEPVNLG